jgi:hypothetical protein
MRVEKKMKEKEWNTWQDMIRMDKKTGGSIVLIERRGTTVPAAGRRLS